VGFGGGHSKVAGRSIALTELLFSWFLSRDEGTAFVEQALQNATGLPETGLSPTGLGKWLYETQDANESWHFEPGVNGFFKAALDLVRRESFGAHAFADASWSYTNPNAFFKQLGDKIKASSWWKEEGKAFRKQYRDSLVVKEVQEG
jgi:hypothetical protein